MFGEAIPLNSDSEGILALRQDTNSSLERNNEDENDLLEADDQVNTIIVDDHT